MSPSRSRTFQDLKMSKEVKGANMNNPKMCNARAGQSVGPGAG